MSNPRQSKIPVYRLGAFSAAVRIELLISGKSVPVAQIGSDRIIFDQPVILDAAINGTSDTALWPQNQHV